MSVLQSPGFACGVLELDRIVPRKMFDRKSLIKEWEVLEEAQNKLDAKKSDYVAQLVAQGILPKDYREYAAALYKRNSVFFDALRTAVGNTDEILLFRKMAEANQREHFDSYEARCWAYIGAHRAHALASGFDEDVATGLAESKSTLDPAFETGACPYSISLYLFHRNDKKRQEVVAALSDEKRTEFPEWTVEFAHRIEDQRRVRYIPIPVDCSDSDRVHCFWRLRIGRARCECEGPKFCYNDSDVAWDEAFDLEQSVDDEKLRCLGKTWYAGYLEWA